LKQFTEFGGGKLIKTLRPDLVLNCLHTVIRTWRTHELVEWEHVASLGLSSITYIILSFTVLGDQFPCHLIWKFQQCLAADRAVILMMVMNIILH